MIDAASVAVWAFGAGYILFALLKHTVGLRVSKEEEMSGLDISEHGYSCYPEFVSQETAGGIIMEQRASSSGELPEGVRT